jgi:hypothetical protein
MPVLQTVPTAYSPPASHGGPSFGALLAAAVLLVVIVTATPLTSASSKAAQPKAVPEKRAQTPAAFTCGLLRLAEPPSRFTWYTVPAGCLLSNDAVRAGYYVPVDYETVGGISGAMAANWERDVDTSKEAIMKDRLYLAASAYYGLHRPGLCERRMVLLAHGEPQGEPSEFEQIIREMGKRHEQEHRAGFPGVPR